MTTGPSAIAIPGTASAGRAGFVLAWAGALGLATAQEQAPVPPPEPVPVIGFGAGGATITWFAARGHLYRVAFLRAGAMALHDCGEVITGDDRLASVGVGPLLAAHGDALTFFQISALTDSDEDGLGDRWELDAFGSTDHGAGGDADGDGVDNATEFRHLTSPAAVDSDGDGLQDGFELLAGSDPLGAPSLPLPGATGLVVFVPGPGPGL